ncbi:arylsulfatase [Flammeovirga pacifica]|uniref:Arylsulfatase n=1 Tax=Flammeovirga pacifica TaxID=915059 RepID=A0A1S1YUV6_FLAPC|nr:arylsulfatase [Flammeovirga pacifica]OHX64801.1 arylsulfatase [Flammeovirga pacifica]
MKRIRTNILALLLGALAISCASSSKSTTKANKGSKPNIIYILADDLGYGDLSSYGQQKFTTPNIDALAEGGIKFTQHYCGSAVCAPSRSTLMTGQHTGHTPIRGNKELKGQEGQTPLPKNAYTVAEVMKDAGYTTGAFGKWGLGFIGSEGDAINQGFDTFYGYNCQRVAHRYYPEYLWDNDQKDFLPGNDWTNKVTYAPDVIQEKTLEFIEDNKNKPFFVYVPFTLPHAELIAPADSVINKFKGKYPETPHDETKRYTSDYGPNIKKEMYCPQETPHAAFASMIYTLDIYVGQIVDKVEELGIADNTIIMFASDNGPHEEGGADPAFFNSGGNLRGVKRDLYEGGVRTPFIVKWPNKIKAGETSTHISAFWDVLPTLADIVGIEVSAPTDGISFLPTLMGQEQKESHPYMYWELPVRGGRQAVRLNQWKGVKYNITKPNARLELYNLENDPEETEDVSAQYPEVVKEIEKIMVDARVDNPTFPLFSSSKKRS